MGIGENIAKLRENAGLVKSISGMIFSGVTGELLNVESNGSKVIIRVEDYEG